MIEKEHSLWVEKYRPIDLENYIGNEQLKTKLARYIASGDIPHILLSGPPGTGKTTAAKMIVNSINCDYKYINASSENSVDNIRNNVKTFASMGTMKPIKVIILDEADYITIQAQMALRNLMEATSRITRFILTCNYVERIDDSIISRTQQFHVVPPSKKEVCIHVAGILKKENVVFQPADIKLVVDAFYPDIRKIINELQLNTIDKDLKIEAEKIIGNDFKLQIVEALVAQSDAKKKFQVIRQIIADSEIRDFSGVYRLLFDRVTEYAKGHISEAILAIAEGQYKDVHVVDKEINFIGMYNTHFTGNTMKKFEYRVIMSQVNNMNELNGFGLDGWELVSVVASPGIQAGYAYYYMKREIEIVKEPQPIYG